MLSFKGRQPHTKFCSAPSIICRQKSPNTGSWHQFRSRNNLKFHLRSYGMNLSFQGAWGTPTASAGLHRFTVCAPRHHTILVDAAADNSQVASPKTSKSCNGRLALLDRCQAKSSDKRRGHQLTRLQISHPIQAVSIQNRTMH